MLIFFIVTTSFVHEIGVEMNRSSNEALTTEDESEIIFVRIDDDGNIYVRDRQTDIRLVHANIEMNLATMPDAAVVVAAARNSDAGLLVKVVDQARVAGAQQVSMVALSELQ
jgi:biopolymer transport protein ExbD